MGERCYTDIDAIDGELRHGYGPNVHLLADPLALTWLARLSHPSCVQPEVNRIVTLLYRGLVREVINREFPRKQVRTETRMRPLTEHGYYEGEVIDPDVEATSVDIARAGILPSMVCFEALSEILSPGTVRQDHILMNRTTNADDQVTGAATHGRKIAGPVADRFVLFPDPMGATGGSLTEAISFYRDRLDGQPRHCFALNLIVTPEFINKLTTTFPDGVSIYAYRLDRGLSAPEALAATPGTLPDQERGLTETQYIVPGAGGMGEVMNNALS
ncbi:MAG: uracil phosphoribosyltransferase [Myxococcales bacterium]|nr:uracil phosphoribosyltransferase [Myxococcales bacterium]